MRFFAHDGKTVHGPSPVEELTKLPGFDGDTLVCPVGSENSLDWKPALAYPPFRAVLLAPRPSLPSPKLTPPPARPAPAPPAKPCPACSHRNPEKAKFCNECGERMDGMKPPKPQLEPVPLPVEPPSPLPIEPPAPLPVEPSAPLPVEAPAPVAAALPAAARSDSSVLRKTMIAAFIGATVAGGGLGWWLLRPAPVHVPSGAELDMTPPAPSEPAPAPKPVSSLPVAVSPAPIPPARVAPARVAPAPRAPAPAAPAPAAPAPRRKIARRAQRAKPVKAVEPAAEPKLPVPEEGGVMLPGIPRRVSATPKSAPEDAAAKPDAAEDPAAGQVREQYDFCSQLLTQGAFADHFDTCLCSAARASKPFHGDRAVYAEAMKKLAAAGGVKVTPPIGPIALDGSSATVKTAAGVQRWALEDGLWCRAP